jgi:hypothetical protein
MHTVKFNRTRYSQILACICPQILSAFPARFWRKYRAMPSADCLRLVWSTQCKKSHPDNLIINPHYKEI